MSLSVNTISAFRPSFGETRVVNQDARPTAAPENEELNTETKTTIGIGGVAVLALLGFGVYKLATRGNTKALKQGAEAAQGLAENIQPKKSEQAAEQVVTNVEKAISKETPEIPSPESKPIAESVVKPVIEPVKELIDKIRTEATKAYKETTNMLKDLSYNKFFNGEISRAAKPQWDNDRQISWVIKNLPHNKKLEVHFAPGEDNKLKEFIISKGDKIIQQVEIGQEGEQLGKVISITKPGYHAHFDKDGNITNAVEHYFDNI